MGGSGPPAAGDTVYVGGGMTITVNSADVALNVYVGHTQSTKPGAGTIAISGTGLTVGGGVYIGSSTNAGTINQNAAACPALEA